MDLNFMPENTPSPPLPDHSNPLSPPLPVPSSIPLSPPLPVPTSIPLSPPLPVPSSNPLYPPLTVPSSVPLSPPLPDPSTTPLSSDGLPLRPDPIFEYDGLQKCDRLGNNEELAEDCGAVTTGHLAFLAPTPAQTAEIAMDSPVVQSSNTDPVADSLTDEKQINLDSVFKQHPFLVPHDDLTLRNKGFTSCKICKMKVRVNRVKSVSEHLSTAKHHNAHQKIRQRLKLFTWLRERGGRVSCAKCGEELEWRSLQKVREHQEECGRQRTEPRTLDCEPDRIGPSSSRPLAERLKQEAAEMVKVEEEQDAEDEDKILLQVQELGRCVREELIQLRSNSIGSVDVVGSDGVVVALHLEPLLLSTSLLQGHTQLQDVEVTILCPDYSSSEIQRAVDVLYTGETLLNSQDEREKLSDLLRNLCWKGSRGSSPLHMVSHCKMETWDRKKDEVMLINGRHSSSQSNRKRGSSAFVSAPAPGNETNHLAHSRPTRGRTQPPAGEERSFTMDDEAYMQEEADNANVLETVDIKADETSDDGDWDMEPRGIGGKRGRRRKGGTGGGVRTSSTALPKKITLKTRLLEYDDLIELDGDVICKVCKIPLDWTKRSRLNEHMKSVKHKRAGERATQNGGKTDNHITDIQRFRIKSRAKQLRGEGGQESSDEEEYHAHLEVPLKEKLVERLGEFPWLRRVPGLEEVRCIFCRSTINWERKSHIQDHLKSKKHLRAAETKKEKYPEVIKKIRENEIPKLDECNKPNNGDRLQYRIHLKQGTPAIQKLWAAGKLIGTITNQISICYICFKLYLSQTELMTHFQIEHKDIPNKSIHSPLFNKETKEFFCNGCNKYTESKKSLMCFLVHNLICTKRFYTVSSPLKCFKCEESFTVYKNFKDHLETVHEDLLPERLMCTDCPQTYLTNEELKRHINQVHTVHTFPCPQCPSVFRSKNSMKEHVVKHHIGVRNFSCDTCGKEFYGKQNLRMHMRIHVAPDQRPHACNRCGMRFIERKHLHNHEATHTNDRPHKCHLCDSRFKVRDWLSNHYIKQHQVSIKEVESKYKNVGNAGNAARPEVQTTSDTLTYYHQPQ